MEEHEILFEEIGFPESTVKIDKIKKIVKLNLKIKRLPKRSSVNSEKYESDSYKPSTTISNDDNSKSELVPQLCNDATCPATNQILNAIEELRDLVKKSCNETRDIRKDLLGIKNVLTDDNPSYVSFMRGPCQTLDDLNLLENRVQEDETSRKTLERLLDRFDDYSLEKYLRWCLKALISPKVAAECTWHAKKDSIYVSVRDMVIIKVISDCARKKFPTANSTLIAKIIKNWFQYSKERWRRSMETMQPKA